MHRVVNSRGPHGGSSVLDWREALNRQARQWHRRSRHVDCSPASRHGDSRPHSSAGAITLTNGRRLLFLEEMLGQWSDSMPPNQTIHNLQTSSLVATCCSDLEARAAREAPNCLLNVVASVFGTPRVETRRCRGVLGASNALQVLNDTTSVLMGSLSASDLFQPVCVAKRVERVVAALGPRRHSSDHDRFGVLRQEAAGNHACVSDGKLISFSPTRGCESNLSRSSCVSLLCRNGIWVAPRSSARMHSFSASRLLLISAPSMRVFLLLNDLVLVKQQAPNTDRRCTCRSVYHTLARSPRGRPSRDVP